MRGLYQFQLKNALTQIRFWNKLKKAESLSEADKKSLLSVLDGLLLKNKSKK
jgi:hypothetical protein